MRRWNMWKHEEALILAELSAGVDLQGKGMHLWVFSVSRAVLRERGEIFFMSGSVRTSVVIMAR